MSGVLAAIWLLGLLAAAPALRTGPRYAFVDRLRDAAILGVAIPFALGMLHVLYPAACWVALALCGAIAYVRGPVTRSKVGARQPIPYVLIAALALVAWPALMRPLLDGDSLVYHLPNAASWVQSHSVWTSGTRYWWYPPASEMFAAALYAVSGPFSVAWSGFAALTLLGFRIVAWTRDEIGAPPLLADAFGAATIAALPLALQAGSLQNDVWLAAFWLESLATMARGPQTAAMWSIAVCALTKPDGWAFAIVAALASRARAAVWLAGGIAVVLWAARDAAMWAHAFVPPSTTERTGILGTTILAHGLPALELLVTAMMQASPYALLALAAALAGPLLARRDPRLGWCGLAAVLIFLALPFGYESTVAQLATGASLRLAAPAVAAGALILAAFAVRATPVSLALLWASSAFGAYQMLAIYWNDASTHASIGVAVLAVGAVALAQALRTPAVAAVTFAIAVVAANHFAAKHPLDYYVDALRVGGKASGVYAWLVQKRPAAIGGWALRAGVVDVLLPQTQTLDLPEAAPCSQARAAGALLVAVSEDERAEESRARLGAARRCGTILYDDGLSVVTAP